jgi:L-ribulokinase
VKNCVPASYFEAAKAEGVSIHKYLREKAKRLPAGSGGLLALDWWNGNRTPYVDGNLSGVIVGLTTTTPPEAIYRALIEATAYGTKRIIEIYEKGGINISRLYAAGGIAEKDEMLMQIYADVTGREIMLAGTSQACAFGSAILGSVNEKGYATLAEAAEKLKQVKDVVYRPIAENKAIYDELYGEYYTLSEYFAKSQSRVMEILKKYK